MPVQRDVNPWFTTGLDSGCKMEHAAEETSG